MVNALLCISCLISYGQVQFKYDSNDNGIEIEKILDQFKSLTVKLPSYGDEYFPYVYTMNMQGLMNLEFIPEVINPQNIDSARLVLCNVLKQGERSSPFKIVVICFVDKLIDPKNGEERPAISMYVEHTDEKNAFAYYLPYDNKVQKIIYDKTKLMQRIVERYFFK
ncbi:MAG: hypothetical protein ACK58Q_11580 [Chitinophagales bacterium]